VLDDYLWLPYAVSRYVAFTGDTGVLDEQVPYLTGRASTRRRKLLRPARPRRPNRNLYEHCTRAILKASNRGVHGLRSWAAGTGTTG